MLTILGKKQNNLNSVNGHQETKSTSQKIVLSLTKVAHSNYKLEQVFIRETLTNDSFQ